jgi:hypothetical protein
LKFVSIYFALKDITAEAAADLPKGTSVALYLRGGSTPAYESSTWDPWRPSNDLQGMKGAAHDWKFFQWKAVLSTQQALVTPALKKVTVTATIEAAERRPHRRPVRKPFHHPRLLQLRLPALWR